MTHDGLQQCPFCDYRDLQYGMLLHMEHEHAEPTMPVAAKESNNGSGVLAAANGSLGMNARRDTNFADCPVDGCGEVLRRDEMDYHVELHAQEEKPADDEVVTVDVSNGDSHVLMDGTRTAREQAATSLSRNQTNGNTLSTKKRDPEDASRHKERGRSIRNRRHSDDSDLADGNKRRTALDAWRALFFAPSSATRRKPSSDSRKSSSTGTPEKPAPQGTPFTPPVSGPPQQQQRKRLGKAELGKYAHEDAMPAWLVAHLRKGGEVKAEGVLPVLEQLLEQCPSTKYAYLCHHDVQHVSKLKKEGGFCGYRNIQMMVSYINAVNYPGSQHFDGKIPTIFRIQDLIENAWDKGFNAQGRIETGGVRMTRKYIGTPEAQAVLCSLDIPCDAQGFKNKEPGKSEARLLQEVEKYFQAGVSEPEYKVRRTNMPPIYFQHAGHSMTIVGLEKLKNGEINLLVFDPMFRDPSAILKLVGRNFEYRFPDLALKSYRRGNRYLKKYHEFEILRLRPMPKVTIEA